MFKAVTRAIGLALLFMLSGTASAKVWVQTNLGSQGNSPSFRTYNSLLDPLADGNITAENRFAEEYPLMGDSYAFVDSARGILKAKAISDLTLDAVYGYVGVSQASATISDTITFKNFEPGQIARLKYSFNGVLGLGPMGASADDAYAYLNIVVSNAFNANIMKTMCIGRTSDETIFGNSCQGVGEHFNDGEVQIPMSSGDYKVQVTLSAQSIRGNKVELNDTRLFLELPNGVAMSSESGSFLVSASSVPEPQAVACFTLGLIVIGWRRRRSDTNPFHKFAVHTMKD